MPINYKPPLSFVDRSNKRKEQTRWCLNHPRSFWGEGFERCVTGNYNNESCEEGENTHED